MNILDVAFVEELVDACQYFWEAGWGEYHAGNISYLLSDDEFDQSICRCRHLLMLPLIQLA